MIRIPSNYQSKELITMKEAQGGISIGDNSAVTILVHDSGSKPAKSQEKITIGNNSDATITYISGDRKGAATRRMFSIGKNSDLRLITVDCDSKPSATENIIELTGQGAKAKMLSLQYSDGRQQNENTNIAVHNAKGTESLMITKSVLVNSKASNKGMIRISQNAAKSNGYQQTDTLLIGDSSSISVPELEIHNNDVRCTHGSTTTHPDEEKLFYLRSRGLSGEDAQRQLISGFFEQSLNGIPDTQLTKIILSLIKAKIGVNDE